MNRNSSNISPLEICLWSAISTQSRGQVMDGDSLGHRFVRAHLTPWVGLYSVMSEDSVRKLAKTVFPLCENEDNKKSFLKSREVNHK